MSDETRKALADLIDTFNKAWVRPATWNEGQLDDVSIGLRERWAIERDKWTVNLLELIRTWLLYPGDGSDADLEASPDALPSYGQSIENFRVNMTQSAEIIERHFLEILDN